MGKYISEEVIEQVRRIADIVGVISSYVNLKKRGANYQARCPFHQEKTPSFSVSAEKQIFKCFGCGEAGNVFHFLMKISGLTFPEAVVQLAEKYGISIEYDNDNFREERKSSLELLAWTANYFHFQLKSNAGTMARDYLEKRKINQENIEKFKIGYAPEGFENLLNAAQAEGFSIELLLQSGLVSQSRNNREKYYDRFRNRVMFPIWNVHDEVIAFGGRVLAEDAQPKYLNSPESNLFSKRHILYALNHARSACKKKDTMIIMEGYTDVIMAHQYGFCHTVASLGTALTEDHARLIKRHTESVILVFDGDAAGQKAMSRSLQHFITEGLQVRIAVLPEKVDPCDFLTEKGEREFEKAMEQAQDILDFQIERIAQRMDLNSTGGQRTAIAELQDAIKQIPDTITQRLFTTKLAKKFNLPVEMLENKIIVKNNPVVAPMEHCRANMMREEEEFLLWVALRHNERRNDIFQNYQPVDFQTAGLAQLAEALSLCMEEELANVAGLSSRWAPELGKRLISIYYKEYDDMDQDAIALRLDLNFKALARQKRLASFRKLKSELNTTAPEDESYKTKILEDAREICREHKHFSAQ